MLPRFPRLLRCCFDIEIADCLMMPPQFHAMPPALYATPMMPLPADFSPPEAPLRCRRVATP